MARRRTIGDSRPIIVDRVIGDRGDDELDLDDLLLEDDDLFDLDDEDAAWALGDEDEAWCDCAPWIEDELCGALWLSVYRNLKRRRCIH